MYEISCFEANEAAIRIQNPNCPMLIELSVDVRRCHTITQPQPSRVVARWLCASITKP
jgi:hypothetical protein